MRGPKLTVDVRQNTSVATEDASLENEVGSESPVSAGSSEALLHLEKNSQSQSPGPHYNPVVQPFTTTLNSSTCPSPSSSLSLDELFALATSPRPSRPQSQVSTPINEQHMEDSLSPSSSDLQEGKTVIRGARPEDDAEIGLLLAELRKQDEKLQQAGLLGIKLHSRNEELERVCKMLQRDYSQLKLMKDGAKSELLAQVASVSSDFLRVELKTSGTNKGLAQHDGLSDGSISAGGMDNESVTSIGARRAPERNNLKNNRDVGDAGDAGQESPPADTSVEANLRALLEQSRSANQVLHTRNKSLNKHCAEADNRIEELDRQVHNLTLQLRKCEHQLKRARKELDENRKGREESERLRIVERKDSERRIHLLRQKSSFLNGDGDRGDNENARSEAAKQVGANLGSLGADDNATILETSSNGFKRSSSSRVESSRLELNLHAANMVAKKNRREIATLRSEVACLQEKLDLSRDRVLTLEDELKYRDKRTLSTPSSPIVRIQPWGEGWEKSEVMSATASPSAHPSSATENQVRQDSLICGENHSGLLQTMLRQAQSDLRRESSIRVRLDSEVRVYQQLCERHDAEHRALQSKLRETEARLDHAQSEARVSHVKLRQLEISSAEERMQEIHALRMDASAHAARAKQVEELQEQRLLQAENSRQEAEKRALGFQEEAMALMKKLAAIEREREENQNSDGGGQFGTASPSALHLGILEEMYTSASLRVRNLRSTELSGRKNG